MNAFELSPNRFFAILTAVLALSGCGSDAGTKGGADGMGGAGAMGGSNTSGAAGAGAVGGSNTSGAAGAGAGGSSTNGAGGSGTSGGCQPVVLTGSPFGSSGTATVTGMGTLPDGIADGLELQMEVNQGSVTYGVLADNLFAENDRICGKTFRYTIHGLSAGTYRLGFVVFDPNSNSLDPTYEGFAPSDFMVADGQMLTLDATFTLK